MQQHKQMIESSYGNVHSDTGSMSSILLLTNKHKIDSFHKANTSASNNALGSSTTKKQKCMQLLEKITNHNNATNNECYYIGTFKNINDAIHNANISIRQSSSYRTLQKNIFIDM